MYDAVMDFQLPHVESSTYVRTLRIVTSGHGLPPHLLDTTRPLSTSEVDQLKRHGNRCDDWGRLLVHHEFTPEAIWDSEFAGTCVLGQFRGNPTEPDGSTGPGGSEAPGIRGSVLTDAVVGSGAVVEHCPGISGAILDRSAVAIAATIEGPPGAAGAWPAAHRETPFGNGARASVPGETAGATIPIYADLDVELLERLLEPGSELDNRMISYERLVADYRRLAAVPWTYVSPEAEIRNAVVRASYIGIAAVISDDSVVEMSSVVSTKDQPAAIRHSSVERSVLKPGARVTGQCIVKESALLEQVEPAAGTAVIGTIVTHL